VGVKREEQVPSMGLLRVLGFIDQQVQLGNPEASDLVPWYRETFFPRLNKRVRVPLFALFMIMPLIVLGLVTDLGVCAVGAVIGFMLVIYVIVIIVIEARGVVERPNGYWKENLMAFDETLKKVEEFLVAKGRSYYKIDVDDFFETSIPTTVYVLAEGPPPVYVVVWNTGIKSLIHVGYRTEENRYEMKQFMHKLVWAA
jgi:hypothetical protein